MGVASSAVALLHRLGRAPDASPIKVGIDGHDQRQLIVLDGQDIVPARLDYLTSDGFLREQSIGRDHPPLERQRCQELLDHPDLVGLLIHAHLSQRQPDLMGLSAR